MAEDHVLLLGKLTGNLQSLETSLRLYLLIVEKAKRIDQSPGTLYWNMKKGDIVAVDAFTNYDQLSGIIEKFNLEVDRCGYGTQIDKAEVVRIRDLLAHGRVSANASDERQLKIIKFENPKGSQTVVVSDCAMMNAPWFRETNDFIRCQLECVIAALKNVGAISPKKL